MCVYTHTYTCTHLCVYMRISINICIEILFLGEIHTVWSNIVIIVSEKIDNLISSLYIFMYRYGSCVSFLFKKNNNPIFRENYEKILKQLTTVTTKSQPECLS